MSLEKDLNGECWVVFPDVPVFRLPNVSRALTYSFIAFGAMIGAPFDLEDFNVKHIMATFMSLLVVLYFILSWIFF